MPDERGDRRMSIEKFSVIGIEGRTDNTLEIEGRGIIPGMWARFAGDAPRIPNRADSSVVALYTDYESDEHGAYTFFIGAKVSSTTDVPVGMVVREVPAGRYAIFTSGRGPLERMVPETWQRIWRKSQNAEYTRAYATDFELYDTRATNPADAQIDVFIGLK